MRIVWAAALSIVACSLMACGRRSPTANEIEAGELRKVSKCLQTLKAILPPQDRYSDFAKRIDQLPQDDQVLIRNYIVVLPEPIALDECTDVCAIAKIRYGSVRMLDALTLQGEIRWVRVSNEQAEQLGLMVPKVLQEWQSR
ncbi:MAG: hypothetical protein QM770_23290 [Tepidisphaeraceae bacterium]